MLRLDRHLGRKTALAMLVIAVLLLAVVIGLDVVLRLKRLLHGDLPAGTSRVVLILQLYLYSLPHLLSPVLPVITMTAVLLTAGGSLKRNEFTALAASGVSLRRSTRVMLLLALLVGALDVYLSDQITPLLEGRRNALEDQLTGESRTGRIWKVEETGSYWYANRVILIPGSAPRIEDIIVAPPEPARDLLHAQGLVHRAGTWTLTGPIIRTRLTADGRRVRDELDSLSCSGPWTIPYRPEELGQKLVSRYAMTGLELLRRARSSQHGRLYLAHLYSRLSRLVLPCLVVLVVLPVFVRFASRQNLILASIKALAAGMVPITVMSVGALEADNAALPPLVILGIAAVLAAVPGLWLYARWRL